MEKKTKRNRVIVGVVIFCLLYILLAFRPLSTELHLVPDWTESIYTLYGSNLSTDSELIPFRLGQNIGYFTEDGKIASQIPYAFKAAISDQYYATFGADSEEIDFFTARGEKVGTIHKAGFPFFDEDRIYSFLPGGSSFVSCAENGSIKWSYESYAPIIAFDSSKGGTVAGFADGTVVSFNDDGREDQNFAPGGSDFPVILGVGISEDGKTVACISGQNKQRFVIAQKSDSLHSKIIFHEYLPKDINNQVLVKFNKSASVVYYNYNGGLGIVDLKKLKSSHVDLDGQIIQIEESDTTGLLCVLSKKEGIYTVTIIEPSDHPAAQFSFKADCAFIQVRGDALYVGRNSSISRMTIERK